MTSSQQQQPRIYLAAGTEFTGKVKKFSGVGTGSVPLGGWHTEDEDVRSLKAMSILVHLPDGCGAHSLQLWGTGPATTDNDGGSSIDFLASIESESLGAACRWFYIEDVAEWIDNQSLAYDLPVVDDQQLFLVVAAAAQHSHRRSSPATTFPQSAALTYKNMSVNDAAALLEEVQGGDDFDGDLSVQLSNSAGDDDDDETAHLTAERGISSGGGHHHAPKTGGGGGRFDHFFDGLEEDVKEKNDKKFSAWYLLGILIVIIFILIVLYACYRLFSKLSQFEDCCDSIITSSSAAARATSMC